jgi:hypothetical protein
VTWPWFQCWYAHTLVVQLICGLVPRRCNRHGND